MKQGTHFQRVQRNWERFGSSDPMFGVLSLPEKQGLWQEDEFYGQGRWDVGCLFDQLEQAGVVPPTDRLLDFGCGAGRLSFALAEKFDEVDGVDISPSMLAFARKQNPFGDRCRFHLNENPDLRLFESNTFGMAVSLITLQHVPPHAAEKYIAELVRVTRPGGVVALQIPESQNKPTGARVQVAAALHSFINHQIRRQPRMEMHAHSANDVARIMRAAGGTVVAAISDRRCGDWGSSLLHVAVKDG